MRSILFILLLTICFAEKSQAQMFDELKKEEKDLNPENKKIYLVIGAGVQLETMSLNLSNKNLLSSSLFPVSLPVKAECLFKLSRRFSIGPGASFASFNETFTDFSISSGSNILNPPTYSVSFNSLSYYLHAEYFITESLHRNYGISASIGSFTTFNNPYFNTASPIYSSLSWFYNFKLSGDFQMMLEGNIGYKGFNTEGSWTGTGYNFSYGILGSLRFCI